MCAAVEPDGPLVPERVRPLLRGTLGVPYVWRETCDSTQDLLRSASLPAGATAVAERQTAGRGRSGRAWQDVAGKSLLVSVLLRPSRGPHVPELSLVAGLAVAEAVEAESGLAAGVKWPNDVLVDGRKVAGVLLESADDAVICGVGVNVGHMAAELPVGTPTPAGSLDLASGRRHDRGALLATLLERLEIRYDTWLAEGLRPLLPELETRNVARGRAARAGDARGTVGAIGLDGRIELVTAAGIVPVGSGELVLERSPSG